MCTAENRLDEHLSSPDEMEPHPEAPDSEVESEAPALTGDFITDYIRYADVIEAPPEAHEAMAISLLAAALNEKVSFRHGPMKHSLDLWLVILSASGQGRNTLVNLASPLLEAAGLEHLIKRVTWGSKESFYQHFAENPSGLFQWPEFSIVMKTFNNPAYAGAKEWLTDRFDNWNIPDAIQYRRKGNKSDTPPIEFEEAPRINLLATSSYDWFVGSLTQQDSTGGFIPRWLIFHLGRPEKLVPIPEQTDSRLIPPLAKRLEQASKLVGEADLSAILPIYKTWYEATNGRFSQQANNSLVMPFFGRLRTNILKLAIVYEVSMTNTLAVSENAMSRAVDLARKIEEMIFGLLSTGLNQEGSEVDRIAARIRAAGPEGFSQSELTRAFQYMRANDRNARIQTLVDSGTAHRFLRMTAGRNGLNYVHRDHLEEHRSLFPGDAKVIRLE